MNKLIIIGAGGHGRVIADMAEKNGYEEILFLDDSPEVKSCGKHSVVGTTADVLSYAAADFVVAIGNSATRRRIQLALEENGLRVVPLVHPAAVVAPDVPVGAGTVIMAGAVVNPGAAIGRGCIVNTCSSVDHDCRVGDFVHISVGAHLAGTVTVGDDTMIGLGAVLVNNITVTDNVTVGAGAVVVNGISERGIYVGSPARRIK